MHAWYCRIVSYPETPIKNLGFNDSALHHHDSFLAEKAEDYIFIGISELGFGWYVFTYLPPYLGIYANSRYLPTQVDK